MKEVLEKQLFKRIERLEMFEERMGIKIEKLTLQVPYEDWLRLYFEVHPIKGMTLKESIHIEAVVYDSDGNIIQMTHTVLITEKFYAFEVCKLTFTDLNLNNISRVRLYPKAL
ncbi:hypothetical protein ACXYMT_02510 [Salinimicrobium sp. CAU 1759]